MSFSLLDILQKNFRNYKDNTAFVIDENAWSYSELEKKISEIQACIIDTVPSDVQLIGLFTRNDLDTYASILACWFSGKAYLPLNPENPYSRNKNLLQRSEITYLLGGNYFFEKNKVTDETGGFVFLEPEAGEHSKTMVYETGDKDILQYLLYTSGSTGLPKGVPVSRKSFYSFLEGFSELFPGINSEDRFLQIYDLSFDGSFPAWVLPLMRGSSVYTVAPDKVKFLEAYRLIKEYELTVIKMTPSTLAYLRPYLSSVLLPRVKHCIFGGEALPSDIVQEWEKCVPNSTIFNVYGPTECTISVLAYEWTDSERGRKEYNGTVSLGWLTGRNGLTIVDEQGQEVAGEQEGELCISGPQLMKGYWKDPLRTRDSFIDVEDEKSELKRYYKTGDRVFRDKDSLIMFLGRKDFQVQVNGYRVEPGEIERHARNICQGSNVAVIPVGLGAKNNGLVLFIEQESINQKKILEYLKKHVPSYMIPDKLISLAAFPMSPGGKIDTNALKKMVNDG